VHELHEVRAMVREACAQACGLSRITKLKIVVGEASGHNPDHIAAHFREASKGTKAEGAKLEFTIEKLAGNCASCGAVFDAKKSAFACGQCGSRELNITAGKDVRLAGVE